MNSDSPPEKSRPPIWARILRKGLIEILKFTSWGIHSLFIIISISFILISFLSLSIGIYELYDIFRHISFHHLEKIRLKLLKVIEWFVLSIFSYLFSIGIFKAFSLPDEVDPKIPDFFKTDGGFDYSSLEKRLAGTIVVFVILTLISQTISVSQGDYNNQSMIFLLAIVISGFLIVLGISLYIYLVEE